MKMKSRFNFAFAFNERSLQTLSESEKYSDILLFAVMFCCCKYLCLFRQPRLPQSLNAKIRNVCEKTLSVVYANEKCRETTILAENQIFLNEAR